LIVRSGISLGEGFLILSEKEPDSDRKAVLTALYHGAEQGNGLSRAFREVNAFPEYMDGMIEIGERTGNLDSVFKALSQYYERQARLTQTIKSAVVYPAVLFLIMLAVIALLVIQVLPIFNDVFVQLGSAMSPLAAALMDFGLFLKREGWVIAGAILAIAAVCACAFLIPALKLRASRFLTRSFSEGKLGNLIGSARFASAMAMTMSSGMDTDSSLGMAEKLCGGYERTHRKIIQCRRSMQGGKGFADTVAESELFSPLYCRMLDIGVKTGAADTVMEEIARKSGENVETQIDRLIGKVEPVLIILMSLLVGLVLMSVMLPLLGIMSSIG